MKISEARNFIKNNLRKIEVDRPAFFSILSKAWLIITGPITIILIIIKFSPELQGYYYTFSTLLALQVFVELGLGVVIIQFASHEWSRLSITEKGFIAGSEEALSRLGSLARLSLRWYAVGAAFLILFLGIGGYVFFLESQKSGISWVFPWFSLCFLTGINLCLAPIWSLLEGCNQLAELYFFKFWQGLLVNLSIWIAILSGAGLFALSVSSIMFLACGLFFIKYKYWYFFRSLFFLNAKGPRIKWYKDIFPMQWRIAVSWVGGYFVFSLFTPVLFKFHGSVVAGQMGMTWNLVGIVIWISSAWLAPKIPRFGMLIAKKDYETLDKLFFKMTRVVLIVSVILGLSIWFGIFLLYNFHSKFAVRFLPPLTVAIFLLAQIIVSVSLPASGYLRAHKKEPLVFLSVMAGALIGGLTIILGKYYSAAGVAMGYLIVNIIIIPLVFVTWQYCRISWHSNLKG